MEHMDERYLRPIFTRSNDKISLQRLFEKLTLSYVILKHTNLVIVQLIDQILLFPLAMITESTLLICTPEPTNPPDLLR